MVGDSVADADVFDKWKWNSFTTVIDVNDKTGGKSDKLMCKAHSKGLKYGFFGKYG